MARKAASATRTRSAQTAKGITHLQSLNVIRNMIRVSVSEICYLRNLFPEELFKERVYADMHVKCIAPTKEMESKDAKDAMLITQWLEEGVFEALQKKYLSSVALCVYALSADQQPAQLLESYTYTITHAVDGSQELSTSFTGASPLSSTPQQVKAQAIQLIRSLVSITNNLDPLPRNRLITMKVHFNENCPKEWQPQHFKTAPSSYSGHKGDSSLKLAVGRVVTPHHLVTMEIETAEECIESLSQAKSDTNVTRIDDQTVEDPNEDFAVEETQFLLSSDAADTSVGAADADDQKDEHCPPKTSAVCIPDEEDDTPMGKDDFMKFLVQSGSIDKQCIERRFPSLSSSQTVKWLNKLEEGGVIRKTAHANHYEVAVHDTNMFYGAINETHGKMKRQITAEGLEAALGICPALAEALLVRMEEEKLVRKDSDSLFYNVHFSESNRALVRKAIQRAKKRDANIDKAPSLVNSTDETSAVSSADVYDFESDAFVTPTGRSKRKAPETTSSKKTAGAKAASSSRGSRQGSTPLMPRAVSALPPPSCANEPIVQVKKALKKRKLALKPIS